MHLGSLPGCNPADWLKNLPKVRNFNLYFPEKNPVFSIIRVNFDRLTIQEQALFMDIALYSSFMKRKWSRRMYEDKDLIGWVRLVHRQKLEDTQSQLQRLKEKGLLEDVNISSQALSMHDLYLEFAEMESQGKLNSAGFKSRKWVYWMDTYPTELEMMPSGGCWENLIRVCIEQKYHHAEDAISSLQGIQWRYCSNVVVLKLIGLKQLKGVLNLKDFRSLRSLELRDLDQLDGLEGLKDLNSLTYFQWLGGHFMFDSLTGSKYGRFAPRSHLGQLPESLKILETRGAILKRDVFARCTNLCKLILDVIQANDVLDFSNCTSLQTVELRKVHGLQKLWGLAAGRSTSCLQSLMLMSCKDLTDVSELEHLVGLQNLELSDIHALKKLPNLQKLTSLRVLIIRHLRIAEVPGLGSLAQLRELRCLGLTVIELPNLSGLQHLHSLDLSGCYKLTTLEEMGELPALRHLNLCGCESLVRLPDLSKSTNLEELNLWGSGIELQEEDIHMLAKLPMLRLVEVAEGYYHTHFRFDLVRRKVLTCSWFDGMVEEERDLETPPIKVSAYEF